MIATQPTSILKGQLLEPVARLQLRAPIDVYERVLTTGIERDREFEKKRLACFKVNGGVKCGQGCAYCSTSALVRMHKSFGEIGRTSFEAGFAVVDPTAPERVRSDARTKRERGLVEISTIVDSWAPEALRYDLGRRFLDAILPEPGWGVRILTKGASVQKDFDIVEKYRDRVLFGMSITSTPDMDTLVSVIEPNASPISERIAVTQEAVRRGFRTFAMLCPLLPGIGDAPGQIDELVRMAVGWKVEEIFVEPVNARGPSIKACQELLAASGFRGEAAAIGWIRIKQNWSEYVVALLQNVQRSIRRHSDISKLRFLLYRSGLTAQDMARIRQDDEGVIWLGSAGTEGS